MYLFALDWSASLMTSFVTVPAFVQVSTLYPGVSSDGS